MHIHLKLRYQDGQSSLLDFELPCTVGRATDNVLQLTGWRVAKHHACFFSEGGATFIEDYGSIYGTLVNGKRISRYGPLVAGDEVLIGPCLAVVWQQQDAVSDQEQVDHNLAMDNPIAATHSVPLAQQKALHQRLIQALELQRQDLQSFSDAALRLHAEHVLASLIQTEFAFLQHEPELIRTVLDEAIGLGPLERLLDQADISEIMVNGHQQIYIERNGVCEPSPYVFSSEAALLTVIDRIVSPLGRRIDESSPLVDARLKDGSRVHAVIAPIAVHGPCLTIRKFSQTRLHIDDLLAMQALSQPMAEFLRFCVQHKKNILVSGGTGSGKTTLLNILSNHIPAHERIITIEDAAELQLKHGNLVTLEARPENAEGKGAISIRELVRNALRMRPDRIVVGECRGAEAFDMLAAMNTGHEGSMTTLHANNPRDALGRLETLILMAGMELPLAAVREHIAAGIDFIVQQARLHTGRRLITSISELTGMESGRVQVQELFYFDSTRQRFMSRSVFPHCFEDMTSALKPEWFYGDS